MKWHLFKFWTVIYLLIITIQLSAQIIPFDKDRWTINANNVMLENYKGERSVYLQNGAIMLKDEMFENGIIEFDIYLTKRVSFAGLIFRIQDADNYEEIYFRSHHSGHPDAYQYTPVYNGMSGWQIYHDLHTNVNDGLVSYRPVDEGMGYNGILDLAMDRWMHVKVVVAGTEAEIYLDNAEKPSAFIKELQRGTKAGQIGLNCGAGPTHFANFSFQKLESPIILTKDKKKPAVPSNIIREWQVSNVFSEKELAEKTILKKEETNTIQWQSLTADRNGLANISKLHKKEGEINTAWASFEIESANEQIKSLDLGYSDRIRVFCNGQILYSGNNNFRSRDYRYLGTIGYFDTVHLPLKKGKNTIMIAVSENFGGWAIQAKMQDVEGIKIP